ncbi:MAG: hypothetical protein IJV46_06310 [Acidaminococcaceae bacterium]|nr:hypothetical protein [Acidaminococcaceae bacterium]
MYDFFDIGLDRKEMAACIIGVIVVLLVIFGAGYVLGIRNAGARVHDHGDGADHVREQLSTAQVNQREITDGIAGAEAGAARIETGIRHVAESVAATEAAVGDAAGLIDSSQQILGRVRNRGKTGKVAH